MLQGDEVKPRRHLNMKSFKGLSLVALLTILPTSLSYDLQEDDFCENVDGSEGICKRASHCSKNITALRGKRPTTCGFIGKEVILCCPQGGHQLHQPNHRYRPDDSYGATQEYQSDKHHNTKRSPKRSLPIIIFPDSDRVRTKDSQRSIDGQPCTNNDGSKGVCRKQNDCDTLEQSIKSGKRPRLCNYKDRVPTFCCPILSKPLTTGSTKLKYDMKKAIEIAKKKCAEYAKFVIVEIDSPVISGEKEYINQCAILEEPLILGGKETKPKEFPHMAQIGYGPNKNSVKYNCGGSLISERFVLTAAHCNPKKGPKSDWVRLGELNTTSDEDDADPQVFKVIKRINHPEYDDTINLYNDIALFLLEREVNFNGYIRPICLSIKSTPDVRTSIATGWGHTAFGGVESESMLKVSLDIVANAQCSKKFISRQLPGGIKDTQLCAGGQEGKDACQGDSGGPLQSTLTEPFCMYELFGITSFGKGCGLGYPGIYTRVVSYLPWIVSTVWPE